MSIVDVTDKSNPVELANVTYPDSGYSHQGWLTPDHAYFLHNDETDEAFGAVPSTTTRIFDVGDLDAIPEPVAVHHPATSIGHNLYVNGSSVYASNYASGLRIFDAANVADGELPEVAYFDLYPEHDDPVFGQSGPLLVGSWGNYSFFAQKKLIAAGSMDRGLFLLQPRSGR